MTGLRRGEILGLAWSDVDLEAGRVRVRRSLEQLRAGECAFKEPKTAKSRRVASLPREAVEILRIHRARQNALKLACGGNYNAGDLVFPEPSTGEAWGPDRFSRTFSRCAKRLGVNITFHGMRHSFATVALRAGVDLKVVSTMLGHATIGVTANIYQHVADDLQRVAADRVSEAFAAARRKADAS